MSEPDLVAAEPPPPPPPTGSDSAPIPTAVRASRLFAGSGQFPPADFAAYGIVAFRSAATSDSRERYENICEGFLAGLVSATELEMHHVPLADQMATVWPMANTELATVLNNTRTVDAMERCGEIVAAIDTITSNDAIRHAMRASDDRSFAGKGPYVIAWSPAAAFGDANIPVLVMDLSNVTTAEKATKMFVRWAVDIERSPELWRGGWSFERLREILASWADEYGPMFLFVLDWIK